MSRAAARVLVVGSLNTDLIIRTDTEPPDDGAARVTGLATASGGHGGNCATVLAALGCRVSLATVVGDDAEGAAMLAELAGAGVDTEPSQTLPGASTGRVFIPVYPGRRHMLMHRGATDLWDPKSCETVPFDAYAAVVLFDPPEPVALRVLELAAQAATPVFWNPGGLQAARLPGQAASVRWLAVNRAEYRAAFGAEPDARHLGGVCRDRDRTVVVTLGPEGAMAGEAGEVRRVRSRRVDTVDATGAGDAFAAGFVAAYLRGRSLPEALRWGAAAGAYAVTVPGARAPGLTLAEVDKPHPIEEVP
ncbi:carbohydrate kinase family protein [Streptomyces hygroscopicus]|uniref:carbohydrate kinase family protein n=1 Tax=Streptomyces hygroscopicus TaxID=1912 RepID=UPI00078595EF|nr:MULTISPECIES: PfkB family carbohydrate kinase [Streptomyces]